MACGIQNAKKAEHHVCCSQHSVSHVVRSVTFSANKQYGPFYYDEFDTEIKARNFVLAFPLSGVRFIRQAPPSSAGKQRWMIVQTYKGNVETIPVMFCCF